MLKSDEQKNPKYNINSYITYNNVSNLQDKLFKIL